MAVKQSLILHLEWICIKSKLNSKTLFTSTTLEHLYLGKPGEFMATAKSKKKNLPALLQKYYDVKCCSCSDCACNGLTKFEG